MRTIFFLFAFLMTYYFHYGQSNEFGAISESDLSQEFDEDFPDASAVLLFKKIDVKIDSEPDGTRIKNTYIQERVKIFNRSGFDVAQKYIRLLNNESIKNPQALTYNLIDGEMVIENFKRDSIVSNENNSELKIYRYILSGLKEGCILEFKYYLVEDCCSNFDLPLQENIPIKKFEVTVAAPQFLNYRPLISNELPSFTKIEESSRITDNYNYVSGNGYGAMANNQSVKEDVFNVTFSNIHAVKDEPYANTNGHKATINFEINQDRNFKPGSFKEDTNELTSKNYSSSILESLSQINFSEDEIYEVLRGSENEYEKIYILFNFLKMKIKWNGLTGVEPIKGLEEAYRSGLGNVAEVNLTLLKMLKSVGIEAYPVLLNINSFNSNSDLEQNKFNYVICSVNVNGTQLLLDASDDFSAPNVLPERALVNQGLLFHEDGSTKRVDLTPVEPSVEKVSVSAKVQSDDVIRGSVKSEVSDHIALEFKEKYSKKKQSEIEKEFKQNYQGLNIYNFKLFTESNFKNASKHSYQFVSSSSIKRVQTKLTLKPLLFFVNDDNPFQDTNRQYPVDFKYPLQREINVNIIIPQGYEIESVPKNEILRFEELDAEFTYFLRPVGNMIELYMSLKQNKTLVSTEDYDKLREFYYSMYKKKKELIILSSNDYGSKRSSKNSK